ncbi:MAG: hypothetical protein ACI9M3_001129 [Bacteroidia bacterium]|jgi:hypothetical protein
MSIISPSPKSEDKYTRKSGPLSPLKFLKEIVYSVPLSNTSTLPLVGWSLDTNVPDKVIESDSISTNTSFATVGVSSFLHEANKMVAEKRRMNVFFDNIILF